MDQVLYLTGFEKFPGIDHNPTADIVEALHDTKVGPFRIVGEVLPSSFSEAPDVVRRAIRDNSPRVVLHLDLTMLDTVLRLESLKKPMPLRWW